MNSLPLSTRQHHALQTTPFRKGDWVMAKEVARPTFGVVKSCYMCCVDEIWVMDLTVYHPDGRKLGRVSPSSGGITSFEPAIPCDTYAKIAEPRFPLKLDNYGDHRAALQPHQP